VNDELTLHRRGGTAECWKFNVQAYLDTNSTWYVPNEQFLHSNRAFVFGNHDDQGDLTRAQIMKIETSYKQSLTQYGPSDVTGSTK
jgi:hypothetical protein